MGFCYDLVDTRVGPVSLVHHQNHGEVGGESFTQHESRLRQRAFTGIHQENDSVHHAETSLDLTTEVGVAGGVDDVDGDSASRSRRPGVVHSGVLSKNRDALFPLQIIGVECPVSRRLVGIERACLVQHLVDQGRFSVVNVSHNGDIAQVFATGTRHDRVLSRGLRRIRTCGAHGQVTRPVSLASAQHRGLAFGGEHPPERTHRHF